MIIRYAVTNFRSIKEEAVLSFVSASKIRVKPDHEVKFGGLSVVKNIGLFGANASGKSNLIKSLQFLQAFIKEDFSPADVAFKGNEKAPTKFDIVFKTENGFYQYTLSIAKTGLLDQVRVIEESLYQLHLNGENSLLYSSDSPIPENYHGKNPDYEAYVRGYAHASHRPFLSYITSNERKVPGFSLWNKLNDAFSFFVNSLHFIGEDILPSPLTEENLKIIEEELLQFDTGLSGVELSNIRPEEAQSILMLYPDLRKVVNQTLVDANQILVINHLGVDLFRFTRTESKIQMQRVVFKHKNVKGNFLFGEESDGTKRLFFLLSGLLCIKGDNKTIIVDEIDRSAHPFLPERLIEDFQISNAGTQTQLVFASHQNDLMDSVLRRDEIYFFEKDRSGATKIFSLMEFKSRTSDHVSKLYSEGRYGAVPKLAYRISKEAIHGADKPDCHKA